MLPVSTQTIRNTIPNDAKKERKKLIGIPPLRFHEFQMDVNCEKKETEINQSRLLKNTFLVLILPAHHFCKLDLNKDRHFDGSISKNLPYSRL